MPIVTHTDIDERSRTDSPTARRTNARTRAEDLDFEAQRMLSRLRSRMFGVEAAPIRIGRFAVLDTIGAGGMGVVFSAYDERLDRKVAVKLLNERRIDDAVHSSRLLREAQALAKLSHPNVVQIYEAGIFDGRVYLAMEYLDGPTLRQWQRMPDRRWQDILERYLEAGRGLAAAHRVGIVHRDFKPANLLLGADGRTRVVDFGLARNVEDASTASSRVSIAGEIASGRLEPTDGDRLTRTGELMGTPAYMSPEQICRESVDARSDQFSFCVALYEGLFGARPHPGRGTAEVLISISGGDVVPPPRRRGVPRRIVRALMRGLALAPEERFATMDDLLDELSRDRGRRRRAVMVAAGFGCVGVIATVTAPPDDPCRQVSERFGEIWNDTERDRLRTAFERTGLDYARTAAASTMVGLDDYASAWVASRIDACEAAHVRTDESLQLHDLRVLCLERRRDQAEALITTLSSADDAVVQRGPSAVAALPRVSACDDTEQLLRGVAPPSPELASAVSQVRMTIDRARSETLGGRVRAGLSTAHRSVALAEQTGYAPVLAEALFELGRARTELLEAPQAISDYERVVDLAEAHRADELAADAWIELVYLYGFFRRDLDRALQAARRADAAVLRLGDEPHRRASLLNDLGVAYDEAGRSEDALTTLQRALALREQMFGEDDLLVGETVYNLAAANERAGRPDQAIEYHRRAVAIAEARLGSAHPKVAGRHISFGMTLMAIGQPEAASSHFDVALPVFVRTYGAMSQPVAELHLAMSVALEQQRRFDAALVHAERVVAIDELLRPGDPERSEAWGTIGRLHEAAGRSDPAIAAYRDALEVLEPADAAGELTEQQRVALIAIRNNLGALLSADGRDEEASAMLDAAVTSASTLVDAAPIQALAAFVSYGEHHLEHRRVALAVRGFERAQRLVGSDRAPSPLQARALFGLAMAWAATEGRSERVLATARRARDMFAAAGPDGDVGAEDIDRWLSGRTR